MTRTLHRSPARHSWTLCGILLLAALVLAGCGGGASFAESQQADTAAAYRRFLAEHPESAKAPAARQRLEVLDYRLARAADRPLGYHQYLERYPEGRYVGHCRERLAALALKNARTAADLELLLERYPGSPEAKEARRKLPELLAGEALAESDPSLLRDYLQRFPGAEAAPRVREALAGLVYRSLPRDRRRPLEAFARQYAGTAQAEKALSRARNLLAEEVALTRDPELLREFAARHPDSPELPRLRGLVERRQWRLAVASVNLSALERWTSVPRAARLLRWCRARARPCAALAEQAATARSWRPAEAPEALAQTLAEGELRAIWRVLASLTWVPEPWAGRWLFKQLGSGRFSLVWAAERALAGWWSRGKGEPWRRGLEREVRGTIAVENPDEAQRTGYLALLSGDGARGNHLLGRLQKSAGGTRRLSGAYLLLLGHLRRAGGGAAPEQALLRFLAAAEDRLKWLEQAFPAEVSAESLAPALLAERELFALVQATAQVTALARGAGGSAATRLTALSRRAQTLLGGWRARLVRHDPKVPLSRPVSLAEEVRRHEGGRKEALERLLRDRRPVARDVAAAICAVDPLPSCPPQAASANP